MSQETDSTEDRLAHLLALAINLEPMLFEEVVQVATTDNLTGAYKLSFFRTNLKNELKRAHILRYPVGLLLLDVELPDDIEQQYRILAADQALKAVADTVSEELRTTDWLARCGSDEFAVVLPGCPPDQLMDIARRLLSKVMA
ncbi:MAG: GGDEF domain-containing protein, partial [Anaerolineales bacterium]|nr:GGDEF domain-containing protein [Anaerolineales bacterium]